MAKIVYLKKKQVTIFYLLLFLFCQLTLCNGQIKFLLFLATLQLEEGWASVLHDLFGLVGDVFAQIVGNI